MGFTYIKEPNGKIKPYDSYIYEERIGRYKPVKLTFIHGKHSRHLPPKDPRLETEIVESAVSYAGPGTELLLTTQKEFNAFCEKHLVPKYQNKTEDTVIEVWDMWM